MSEFDRLPKTEECDPKRAVGFAASPVLPGEIQEEFDALLDDLFVRYEPEGPIEEDAVRTIASAIWRKRHLGIFQLAFEARMKWGSYFGYPGDPAGLARIIQEDLKRIDAMTTAFVTKISEEEFAQPRPDSAEKMKENVLFAGSKTGRTKEVSEITMRNALPEGLFKRMVENAIAEITASSAAKTNRKTNHTMSAGDRAAIIEKVVKTEIETEKAKAVNEAPCSIREQSAKMQSALEEVLVAMEMAFGRETAEEIVEGMCSRATETSLAKLGVLLTPENYTRELRINEVLDLTIERAHDRLMKFQASRAKKAAANVISLQPDWVARRRSPKS